MSLILVVHPALSDINFVKMSPHTGDTINHICHRSNGLEYSVIGNAAYYDPDDGGGESLEQFVGKRLKVKVVASPLLVVHPPVCRSHFVRLTPFVDKSVNHLSHTVNGLNYSLIGGGYFADPNDPEAVKRVERELVSMAERVFPHIADARLSRPMSLSCKPSANG